jgi:hypothetical protein
MSYNTITHSDGSITKYKIISSDGSEEQKYHPHFPDLVSSLSVFNSQPKSNIEIEDDLPDDSDYSFYQQVEFFVEEWVKNPNKRMSVTCTIPDRFLWSSTSKDEKQGYDRIEKIGYDECKSWLRRNENGKSKGFVSADAGTIYTSTRLHTDSDGVHTDLHIDSDGVLCITFVKSKGNHRYTMKKMVNPDVKDLRILSQVDFWSIDDDQEEIISKEANRHFSEAQYNKGMGEKNKMVCGYVAKDPNIVAMMDWLGKHEVDYNGILAKSNPMAKNWINIESVSGICNGLGNDYFKKYGEECMNNAIKVTRHIAKEITGEKTFKNSALRGHALWYKTWTQPHEGVSALMTPEQLTDWFIAAYKKKNKDEKDDFSDGNKSAFKLSKLAMSGEVKDLPYILCNLYFDESISLKVYYKNKLKKSIAWGFGSKSKAVDYLVSQTDRLLKDVVSSKITSWS